MTDEVIKLVLAAGVLGIVALVVVPVFLLLGVIAWLSSY